MNKVKVFGRRGSAYKSKVNQFLGNHKIAESHFAVNYGLQGDKLNDYLRRYPGINNLPVLNLRQSGNKLGQLRLAKEAGVPVPVSWEGARAVPEGIAKKDIVIKPFYSLGGRDIKLMEEAGDNIDLNKYYMQKRVNKRRYEIRVHAFAWLDPSKWLFQKRVHDEGDDVLAWNFHNGGRFITIEDPTDPLHDRIREDVKKAMKALKYQFGGADFIIQNPGERRKPLKHHFIEWNLAVGWTLDNTEDYYKDAFLALQDIDIDMVHAMIDGQYPWDMEEEGAPRVRRFRFAPQPQEDPVQFGVPEDGFGVDVPGAPVQGMNEPDINNAVQQQAQRAQQIVNAAMENIAVNFCPRCGTNQPQVFVGNPDITHCFSCGFHFNG